MRPSALQVIDQLLEAGANPNIQLKILPPFRSVGADRGVDSMLTTGTSPLLRAAKAQDAPAIALLLKHGALPNLPNNQGITPTMAAAGLGSVDADTRGWFNTPDVQQRSIASLDLLLERRRRDQRQGRTLATDAAAWRGVLGMERRLQIPDRSWRRYQRHRRQGHDRGRRRDGPSRRQQPRRPAHRRPRRHRGVPDQAGCAGRQADRRRSSGRATSSPGRHPRRGCARCGTRTCRRCGSCSSAASSSAAR